PCPPESIPTRDRILSVLFHTATLSSAPTVQTWSATHRVLHSYDVPNTKRKHPADREFFLNLYVPINKAPFSNAARESHRNYVQQAVCSRSVASLRNESIRPAMVADSMLR